MFIVISVIKQLQAVRELEAAKEGNTDSINTVGENIIATIQMRNNFWYPLKMVISNIAIVILDFSLLLPI